MQEKITWDTETVQNVSAMIHSATLLYHAASDLNRSNLLQDAGNVAKKARLLLDSALTYAGVEDKPE